MTKSILTTLVASLVIAATAKAADSRVYGVSGSGQSYNFPPLPSDHEDVGNTTVLAQGTFDGVTYMLVTGKGTTQLNAFEEGTENYLGGSTTMGGEMISLSLDGKYVTCHMEDEEETNSTESNDSEMVEPELDETPFD